MLFFNLNTTLPVVNTKYWWDGFLCISWTTKTKYEFSHFKTSCLSKTIIRPIIVNYSFIVTRPHRKNLPQNAAWKLIIWSRMEKKSSFFQLLYKTQVRRIQNKTNNIKIVKINLFLSYKERTKCNVTFSIIKHWK